MSCVCDPKEKYPLMNVFPLLKNTVLAPPRSGRVFWTTRSPCTLRKTLTRTPRTEASTTRSGWGQRPFEGARSSLAPPNACRLWAGDDPLRRGGQRSGVPGQRQEAPREENKVGNDRRYRPQFRQVSVLRTRRRSWCLCHWRSAASGDLSLLHQLKSTKCVSGCVSWSALCCYIVHTVHCPLEFHSTPTRKLPSCIGDTDSVSHPEHWSCFSLLCLLTAKASP